LEVPSNPFYCENTAITITEYLEMLGVTVDEKIRFENHIANLYRNVSQQIAVLKGEALEAPILALRPLGP